MGASVVWENPPSTLATHNESTTSSPRTGRRAEPSPRRQRALPSFGNARSLQGSGRQGQRRAAPVASQLPRVSQGPFPPRGRKRQARGAWLPSGPGGRSGPSRWGKRPQRGSPGRPDAGHRRLPGICQPRQSKSPPPSTGVPSSVWTFTQARGQGAGGGGPARNPTADWIKGEHRIQSRIGPNRILDYELH